MKLYKQLFLGLIILSSCQKQASCQKKETKLFNEGHVIVSGQIKHAGKNAILITTLELTGRVDHLAKIDENGHFRLSFNVLSAHDNFLHFGGDLETFFLAPGDSLYLTADGYDFENTIEYSGDNAKFNKCLQMFFIEFGNALKTEKFFKKKNDFPPNEFKEFAFDFFNMLDTKADSITKIVQPENDAVIWLKTYIKYRRAEDLLEYGKHHKKELPQSYYDFEGEFLQRGENDMQCSQYYEDFIEKYYFEYKLSKLDGFNNAIAKFNDRTYDGLCDFLDFVEENATEGLEKNLLLTRFCNNYIAYDYNIVDSIFGKFSQIVDDLTCQNFILQRIDEKKNELILVKTIDDLVDSKYIGEIFKEIKENCTGKVLYIDLWSTWCGSCINNFPHNNKLHKELMDKNIEFVYLCVQSPKTAWEKHIKKNNLEGRHYLLTNEQTSILSQKFNFRGVPRYIIIDKNGTIVDYNAKAPFSRALKDELISLINK